MAIKVFDWQGNERDLLYLRQKYGAFVIQEAPAGAGPVFRIGALYERAESDFTPARKAVAAWKPESTASLVVGVRDAGGAPIDGVQVAWYWPDASIDANAGPLGGVIPLLMRPDRCVHGPTERGVVGFGMGTGAYYWPGEGQIGPHAAWIYGANTRSDVILGLGMVAMTNHYHFDVEFVRYEDEPQPPPPPDWIQQLLLKIAQVEDHGEALQTLAREMRDLIP